MKRLKLLLSLILILSVLYPSNISNAEEISDNTDYSVPEGDGYLANKTAVPITFSVANIFSQYKTGYAYFVNTKTHEVYSTGTNFNEVPVASIYCEPGEYELGSFTFDNHLTPTEMEISMTPSTFVVGEDGSISSDHIQINVIYRKLHATEIPLATFVNDGHFKGYLSISYYDVSENAFQDNHDRQMEYLYHLSVDNGSSIDKVLSGDIYITNIYAYDENKNPLNVYYNPESFKLTEENNKVYLYAFANESELDKNTLATIKENGYILKPANKMCEYTKIPNGFAWVLDGVSQDDSIKIFANDIPYPLTGCEKYTKDPSGKEIGLDYFHSNNGEETQPIDLTDEKKSFPVIPVALVCVIAIMVTIYIVYNKKKK